MTKKAFSLSFETVIIFIIILIVFIVLILFFTGTGQGLLSKLADTANTSSNLLKPININP